MARHWLLIAFLALAHPVTAQQPAPYSYQGTVQAVRRQAHELDLLTGVGEVLRVVHLRLAPTTQMTSGNHSVTAADIVPGDLIRAECHRTPQGLVADRIEKLGPTGLPGAAAPSQP